MLTANLSRHVATNGKFQDLLMRDVDPKKDFFISIQHDREWHIKTPIPRNTLYLEFADYVDKGDEVGNPFRRITDTQAADIAAFMRLVKGRQGNLWVNCYAGIARSGAIVEIALKLGWWKDLEHPIQETRYPNPLVYAKVKKLFPELEGFRGVSLTA